MFLDLNITIFQALSLGLILLAILLTLYNAIIIPINTQIKQISFVQNKLQPGIRITTHNNIDGVVILVLSKTLVIEQKNGSKVEILKQSVKAINE